MSLAFSYNDTAVTTSTYEIFYWNCLGGSSFDHFSARGSSVMARRLCVPQDRQAFFRFGRSLSGRNKPVGHTARPGNFCACDLLMQVMGVDAPLDATKAMFTKVR